MKRSSNILTIIGLILLISCNHESDSSFTTRKGYPRKENLKGDIASVIVGHYNLENKFGQEEHGDLKLEQQFIFNNAGNVVEEITYIPFGNPGYKYSTVKRIYNDQNNLVKKIEHSEDTTYNKKTRYYYNSIGKLAEKKHFSCYTVDGVYNELLLSVENAKYDKAGKLLEASSYSSSGELVTKKLYTYNSKGNLIEHNEYNSEGELKYKYTFRYDRKGNTIEQSKYDSHGELAERRVIIYKKNIPIETHIYSYGELIRKVISKYENGNAIEEINYLANDDIECVFTCKYDDKGNMIQQKLYEGNIKQPAELTIWNIEYR